MEFVAKFISALMESRNQAHIFHLQTKSFATHKAMDTYYNEIIDLIDNYVECYQGKYGLLTGYSFKNDIIESPEKVKNYFLALSKFHGEISPKLPDDSFLRNIEDDIATLIQKVNYLLTLS